MYGIPIKYLVAGGAALLLIIALGLHIRGDTKMREQIITLQVDLRTSETNYTKCESINRKNKEAVAAQQASIDKFAEEKESAIERAQIIAQQLFAERQQNADESAKLRQQVKRALRGSDCANAAIPPDALILLNNAIATSAG